MKEEVTNETDFSSEKAYRIWRNDYSSKYIDTQINFVLDGKVDSCAGGRLKLTREALFLSAAEVANKLQITRSSYFEIEKNDENGKIKLQTLSNAAVAMNCELVYFLRPKSRECYSKVIWNLLEPKASECGQFRRAQGERKQRALYGSAKRVFAKPSFALAQGWSQRRMRMFYGRE